MNTDKNGEPKSLTRAALIGGAIIGGGPKIPGASSTLTAFRTVRELRVLGYTWDTNLLGNEGISESNRDGEVWLETDLTPDEAAAYERRIKPRRPKSV